MADFNFPIPALPSDKLPGRITYTPDGGVERDLGQYAPGFESSIQGRWGKHPIPGNTGDLKEDLGDGSLSTTVQLQFVGTKANDYYAVVKDLTTKRRGVLLHPRRGSRPTVVMSIRERCDWTMQGNETTIVDVTFEDAVLNTASQFAAGPSARTAQVNNQAAAADSAAQTLCDKVFQRPNLTLRARAITMQAAVGSATNAARTYAAAALEAFALGLYGPPLQNQLRALPPLVLNAQNAARLTGVAADTQMTILALELVNFAATQLDMAIRSAQPIPIETPVTRHPGQSIYAFVQQHYGRSGKAPADMRALVGLILRLNRQIRRPSLIPSGTLVVRPA
jgi:hypothetical protein